METINILMIGGKRCGKTTVLASMIQDIGKALAGTNMSLAIANEKTKTELDRATESIRKKLDVFNKPLTRIVIDDNQTDAQKTYSFGLRVGNVGNTIPFSIHDIPGEWLTDTHQAHVKDLIHSSHVIIIAIDTPYLFSKMMTDKGYGIHHEEYNKPMEIANFFKNSLTVEEILGRLILFVPIKCERYYHLTHTPQLNAFGRDYMQELVEAVGNGYRDIIHYLRSTPQLVANCSMAITPILSAGGIDFVHFQKDSETGKVISLYQEAEFLKDEERGYSPKFCEQPMIYSLVYIISKTLDNMGSSNKLNWQLFARNRNELSEALVILKKKLKKGTGHFAEDGFLVIQDFANRL